MLRRRFYPETGLYYCRARYYDPYIGRFIQPDSLGLMPDGAPMNPFSPLSNTAPGNHLYAYCYNDPINMVGPYGFGPKWWHCLKYAWKLRGVAEKCASGECAHVCDDPCEEACTPDEIFDCAECLRTKRNWVLLKKA